MNVSCYALLLAGVFTVCVSAKTQDAVGTYSIRGEDTQGTNVRGQLRIWKDGTITRRVLAGDTLQQDRFAVTFEVLQSPHRVVFTSKQQGSILLALANAGRSESTNAATPGLRVVWSADQVKVTFSDGPYTSNEHGSRAAERYDLKQELRDEDPPLAKISHELTVKQDAPAAPDHTESLAYVRQGDASHEQRTYRELIVNGQSFELPSRIQHLTRVGDAWKPMGTTPLPQESLMIPATYPIAGVTGLVPEDSVRVGGTWTLPRSKVTSLLNMGEPHSLQAKGRLNSVTELIEGGFRYQVEFRIKVEFAQQQREIKILVTQTPTQHTAVQRTTIQATDAHGVTTKYFVRTILKAEMGTEKDRLQLIAEEANRRRQLAREANEDRK